MYELGGEIGRFVCLLVVEYDIDIDIDPAGRDRFRLACGLSLGYDVRPPSQTPLLHVIFEPMDPIFRPEDFERHAFPAVIRAGTELFGRGALRQLEMCGCDYVGLFEESPACRTVVTYAPPRALEYTCTCGFAYGGACEHVVALMRAANARDSVQESLDFDAPPAAAEPEDTERPIAPPAPVAEIEVRRDPPTLRLYLRELGGMLLVEPRFAYADGLAEFRRSDHGSQRLVTGPQGQLWRVERSRAREFSLLADLEDHDLRLYSSASYTPDGNPLDWVERRLPDLAAQGYEIYGREKLTTCRSRRASPKVGLTVRSDGDWLECRLDITIDAIPVSLCNLYDAAMAGTEYVKLSDGSTGVLPDEWVERLRTLFALCDGRPQDSEIRLQSRHVAVLAGLDSLFQRSEWDAEALRKREHLDSFDGIEYRPLPSAFRGSLRGYQQAGYEWFAFLRRFHLGGCLADDMGLGKTVQTLALLCDEKERGNKPRTSLLIVPTSLLFNWAREAQTFTPTLVFATCHGPTRKRYRPEDLMLADVVLTTYGTLLRDIDQFERMRFNYVIVDEAQGLRNPTGAASACVRRLRAEHRLALSGTPLENNLSELWSVMSFLNPGMLGTYSHFVKNIARPIERDSTGPAASMLRRLVHPCILRRTKKQVARDLPPRTQSVLRCEMEGRQKTLYELTAEAWRARMNQLLESGGDEGRMEMLTALLRLRQICCHPRLFDTQFAGESAKFVQLFGMLDDVLADDHKVLIFSSFVGALNLIAERLHRNHIRHEILTGQTKDRGAMVERFQNDPSIRLMLISLKAGGTGLNLTAADYVFHLDPWWNPAAEQQASDRAYRIGQRRPVFIYKLVCADSVEERVMRLQEAKRELFDLVITADHTQGKKLTRDDLLALFA